jgi:DNA-binding beta-propeller fold protein YncE
LFNWKGTLVVAAALALLLSIALAVPGSAVAALPEPLFQIPENSVAPSGEGGRLQNPRAIASDPLTGHLFVADTENARVSEFTAWGVFVKTWGWGVLDGSSELQVCANPNSPDGPPPPGTCQAGIEGSEPGQLAELRGGIAIDPAGDLYVGDMKNNRVEKYDTEGHFLLMFGGEVNKTTGADVCTQADVESGDECGAGVAGTANGQFSSTSVGNFIASGENTIYVGDAGRIQEFNPDGTFKEEIDFEGKGLKELEGKTVSALGVDGAGNLYAVVGKVLPIEGKTVVPGRTIFKLSPSGGLLQSFNAEFPPDNFGTELQVEALAVDVVGDIYAVVDRPLTIAGLGPRVIEFDPSGKEIIPYVDAFAESLGGGLITGIATNVLGPSSPESGKPGDLYVANFRDGASYINAYGPPPIAFEDPPHRPPEIKSQFAISVDTDGAELRAQINPRFWADTTYYLQYGTEECSPGGSSCKDQPLPPGAKLTSKVINAPLTTKGVILADLAPATTYHYRFVAKSSGGGPVAGVGGEPGKDGKEGTFKTFPLSSEPSPCPSNQQFRTGASALLPDCRAYEMVSPLEKNNGDIVTGLNSNGFSTSVVQSASSGDGFTYSAIRSFGNPEGAPYTSQYLAGRDPVAGWSSETISPPRTTVVMPVGNALESEFKAFSADLCTAWLRHDSEPPLAEKAVLGYADLYKRENCGAEAGSYEALTRVKPPHVASGDAAYSKLELQGVSGDGSAAIYVAPDNLADAPNNPSGKPQLYGYFGGQLRFLCYLPDGSKSSQVCSAGTRYGDQDGLDRKHNLDNAISADGSRVYWTETASQTGGPGRLYLREKAAQAQSKMTAGKCSDPTKACSYALSGEDAQFWGATPDGSKALFTTGDLEKEKGEGELHEFDADTKTSAPIGTGVRGVMGASEDLSRVYFVSMEVLASGAEEGAPNLYLRQAGAPLSFIATLAGRDVISEQTSNPDPVHVMPAFRTSRVSGDGLHAVFMSTASLTGYDNTDANSGEADAEVYLYRAATQKLLCISCNPSGARPTGRVLLAANAAKSKIWAAAEIPGWDRSLYASRVLADDGRRLFFESYEALVPRDTNGVGDVYQWEAVGKGGCGEGDATFSLGAGGCVNLISSGKSPQDSTFLDASPSGQDVFIGTLSSLVPQDYGLVDVYDARVNGGFPSPPAPKPPCEGEACQSPPAPPDDPTPSSSTFKGQGNQVSRRCPKGTRKVRSHGRTRCRKKQGTRKAKHKHKRARYRSGRASR